MIKTEIIKINPARPDAGKIAEVAKILNKGGLVAYPTDTVYGLAASCFNKEATERLYEIKKRPPSKPFAIQINAAEKLSKFDIVPEADALRLIEKYWPGPLTLIFKNKSGEKYGFRIPDHSVSRAILDATISPLYVPSANVAAQPAPQDVYSVVVNFDGLIEAIVDGGRCPGAVESTVLDVSREPYEILREGAIKAAQLKRTLKDPGKIVKQKNVLFVCTGNSCRSVMAKGYLKHLADKKNKPLFVESAGTAGFTGMPPTNETAAVLAEDGIDVRGERSKPVSPTLAERADIILVMQKQHKDYILTRYPRLKSKVHLLKAYKNKTGIEDIEVRDPIGKGLEVYQQVYKEIKEEVKRIFEYL